MNDRAITAGFAKVNGTRLYFEAQGAGPPILFLHGFTLDRRMWSRQVEALSSRFRVVRYDARGFGRSALPRDELYRHCDDAAALCRHLGLERVVAVGHSVGAHQLLELALSHPDLVSGLVSICMSGLAGVQYPEDVVMLFGALRATARAEGVAAAKRKWLKSGWLEPAREKAHVARDLDVMVTTYSGWHWMNDNPTKSLAPPARERLTNLRVPVSVISGGRDLPYNTDVARALARSLPKARAYHLPRASHMANMEEPDVVNAVITDLADHVSRR